MSSSEENLYPNDGSYYSLSTPKGQADEADEEHSQVLASKPLVKKMIKRLDERIDFYTSVDSIPEELHTKPDEFMHAFAANKLMVENLKIERGYLNSLISK